MAEPVKLYKGDKLEVIVSPSVVTEMLANGWSKEAPVQPAMIATPEPKVATKPAPKKRGRPSKAKS